MIGTFATAAAGMLETARWAYSDSPSGDVLRRVTETGVQLAWWRRAPEDALVTCLARLPDAALPKLRIAATPGRLTAALEAELGSTAASFRGVIGDIGALGARFAAIAGARRLRVRLEKVTDDACSRWHADRTPLRLLCTYRGAPSLLAKPGAVTGDAHGCVLGVDEAGIVVPRRLDVLILKGTGFGDGTPPVVHRSPALGATDQVRLLLVIDPADDADVPDMPFDGGLRR